MISSASGVPILRSGAKARSASLSGTGITDGEHCDPRLPPGGIAITKPRSSHRETSGRIRQTQHASLGLRYRIDDSPREDFAFIGCNRTRRTSRCRSSRRHHARPRRGRVFGRTGSNELTIRRPTFTATRLSMERRSAERRARSPSSYETTTPYATPFHGDNQSYACASWSTWPNKLPPVHHASWRPARRATSRKSERSMCMPLSQVD